MTRRKALATGAGAIAAGVGGHWIMNAGTSYDDAMRSTWTPHTAKADTDLDYLIHYATLVANNHNAQPWLFDRTAGRVTIRADLSRSTPIVDPDNHHLFASLGCAAENLMLAASAVGKGAALAFIADSGGRIDIDLAGNAARDPLFDAILDRQCTRSDYDGQSADNDDLAALAKAAKIDGCELIVFSERNRVEQALEMIVAANTKQVEDRAFATELRSWLCFSAAHAITRRDGLYAACSGNPTMPQWLGNIVFDFVFKAGSENDRHAKQIRSSAGLVVFATGRDDREHWVRAGRSYQRFTLKATSLGIRHAFVNQPVEVVSARSEFSKWLGMNGGRPDLVIRFGYAPAMPKSLRRPIEDAIVQV